jgi:hypothetical protein
MKAIIFFSSLILFFPINVHSARPHKQILIAGAMEEVILRDIIAEAGRADELMKSATMLHWDYRILRYDSYERFWKPKLSIMKKNDIEVGISAGNAGTAGIELKF